MEVVLYVQRGCVPCHDAAAWFQARGVQPTVRDVTASAAWLAELLATGARATPTAVVTGPGGQRVVTGFHPEAWAEALLQAGGGGEKPA